MHIGGATNYNDIYDKRLLILKSMAYLCGLESIAHKPHHDVITKQVTAAWH